MRPFLKFFVVLTVAFAALCAAPGPARADARLDAYRANGVIAERFDGYVEIRDSNAIAIEGNCFVFELDIHAMVFFRRSEQQSIEVGTRYRIDLLFGTLAVILHLRCTVLVMYEAATHGYEHWLDA